LIFEDTNEHLTEKQHEEFAIIKSLEERSLTGRNFIPDDL